MMSFATSMSCDDVCLWLRQNDVTDDDVQLFKSTPACFLYLLCVIVYNNIPTLCVSTYLMFSVRRM